MRLPSIDRVVEAAGRAARRWPLVLLCAVAAAAAGMLLLGSSVEDEQALRLLYVFSLGLPLFVGIKLVAERGTWSAGGLWVGRLGGLLLLGGVYLARPGWSEPVAVLRYVQLSLGFHLLVAFAPFLRPGELNGFWQFNRTLFLRFLNAAVFSVVLYLGLAGALAAVDNLLGIDVHEETYGRLWFAIAFVFNTWFFVGGVPEDLPALEERTDYPAVIKVFSQFILTPIVAVYLVILTIYLGKILVTRVWPSGWIGYLVSSVAALGILSLLLVHPIEERQENRWVRTYGRWFYVALLPSIAMLLLAIWKRIDQYGITEKRYFLVVLSIWLAGIALFFILRRSRNIKVIPVTLCLVALVTLGGPWGAYTISLRSQAARLEGLLAANGMLEGGRAVAAASEIPFEDRKEMSAVVRYMVETHGTEALDPLLGGPVAGIDTVARELGPGSVMGTEARAELILGSLDVAYVGRWASRGGEESFHLSAGPDAGAIPISGLDYGLRGVGLEADSVEIDGRAYVFEVDAERAVLAVLRDGEPLIDVPLAGLIGRALEFRRSAAGTPPIPRDLLHVSAENDRARLSVFVRSVRGTVEGAGRAGEQPRPGGERGADAGPEPEAGAGRYRITSLSADCYWAEKDASP